MNGNDIYTKLMLHGNGPDGSTTILDSSRSAHTVTAVGTAKISHTQSKFSRSSILFDGSGYLTIPDHADWALGTLNWSVDLQVRFSDYTKSMYFLGQKVDANTNYYFSKYADGGGSSNKLRFAFYGGSGVYCGVAEMTNTWAPANGVFYHIEFVRSGSTPYIFINGVSQAVTIVYAFEYSSAMPDLAVPLQIGNMGGSVHPVLGWMDEVRISKGTARHTASFTPPTRPYPIMIQNYGIEIRNKSGQLKKRIEHLTSPVSWEWKSQGGCGRCTLTIEGKDNYFTPEGDDDIQIFMPDPDFGGATLVYRGYLETINRVKASTLKMDLEFEGYFGWASRVVVHDNVAEKVWEYQETSAIAEDVLDTFMVPKISIIKGTVMAGSFSPDRLAFKGNPSEVFGTLADLQGRVVYGVGPDLVFYWYNDYETVQPDMKWFIGDHITNVQDRIDFRQIKNDIIFEGGKVNDATFTVRKQATAYQDLYGYRQVIVSNGSVTTNSVASRLCKNIIQQEGIPRRQVSGTLTSTKKRLEFNLPIGPVEIIDKEEYEDPKRYGEAGDGGSDITYGEVVDGGSGAIYGETERHYIDRIRYTLDPESGRVNAEVQFGDSLAISLASSRMKQIEQGLEAVRQRSL